MFKSCKRLEGYTFSFFYLFYSGPKPYQRPVIPAGIVFYNLVVTEKHINLYLKHLRIYKYLGRMDKISDHY